MMALGTVISTVDASGLGGLDCWKEVHSQTAELPQVPTGPDCPTDDLATLLRAGSFDRSSQSDPLLNWSKTAFTVFCGFDRWERLVSQCVGYISTCDAADH